jgi:hypothetical protein
MKKLFVIAVALIFMGGLLSSCKHHEKCAAYSKIEKQAPEKASRNNLSRI